MADHLDETGIEAYQIGRRRRGRKTTLVDRFKTDKWLRSWQAEWADCMWSPRAWTRDGAIRKAARWRATGADIERHERVHGYNPKARMHRGITGGRP